MKRILSIILAAMTLLIPTALAADGGDILCLNVDRCVAGNNYLVMLVTPGTDTRSISDGNILFVNQLKASGDSMVVAIMYPGFSACDAIVGGEFAGGIGSPRRLGAYQASRMPGQLSDIEAEAFMGADFTHVYLGDGVNSIGDRAFAQCESLTYISIPGSVSSIAPDAFDGCGSLVIGCPAGSPAEGFATAQGFTCVTTD